MNGHQAMIGGGGSGRVEMKRSRRMRSLGVKPTSWQTRKTWLMELRVPHTVGSLTVLWSE